MNQENRKAGKLLRDSEITNQIIAAAIRAHKELGPGFLESIYEEARAVEFALSGIQFIRQHPIPLFYRDHQIGEHRLDFLVEGKIVVELKAISQLEDIHFAIGRSYLKAMNLQDGLLFNLATAPLTIKRFCREPRKPESVDCSNEFPAFLLSSFKIPSRFP
jgi:GxxExxY protein